MSNASLFELAARQKLRFDSVQGPLSVEELWDLPLTSTTPAKRANLDDIARGLHKKLKSGDDISFVETVAVGDVQTQLKFDIVLHIINTVKAENEVKRTERDRAEKKQKLLALIDKKQDEELGGLSIDDLRAQLNAL